MQLAISKNSWHYKYFRVLCKAWKLREGYESKSLCLYTQIIVWFSFFILMFSPLMIFGWVSMKIGRTIYKLLCRSMIGRQMVKVLDRLCIGTMLDNGEDGLEDCPALTLMAAGCVSFFWLVAIFWAVIMVRIGMWPSLWGLWYFITHCIPWVALHLPSIIWTGLLYIGYGMFCVLFLLGLILMIIKAVCVCIAIWTVKYISLIGMILGAVFLCLLGASLLVYLMIIFLRSRIGKKCIDFFIFKYNGFRQARTVIKLQRVEEEKAASAHRRSLLFCIGRGIIDAFAGMWWGLQDMLRRRRERKAFEDEKDIHIMGLFSLLWNIVKMIKDNTCPLLTFIDEKDDVA